MPAKAARAVIKETPNIIWVSVTNLLPFEHQGKTSLDGCFRRPRGVIKYGSGWRKDAVNRCSGGWAGRTSLTYSFSSCPLSDKKVQASLYWYAHGVPYAVLSFVFKDFLCGQRQEGLYWYAHGVTYAILSFVFKDFLCGKRQGLYWYAHGVPHAKLSL